MKLYDRARESVLTGVNGLPGGSRPVRSIKCTVGVGVPSLMQTIDQDNRPFSRLDLFGGAASLLALITTLAITPTLIWAQGYLYNRADFPTGNSPAAVVAADFNRDGRLDLAVVNEGDNTVSILLGIPSGTFGAQMTYAAGSSPTGLVVADFNGDGKLDLAVMDSCGSCTVSPDTVTVLLGNGDGTFQAQGNYATGGGPIGIVAADFNGDGKIDLALANEVDNTVSILLGNGDGMFKPQTTVAVGMRPYSFASGDFNGDGKVDLVTLNIGDGTVTLLLNNGDGTLTRLDSPSGLLPGPSLGALTVGDFNKDGILDVVVSSEGSQLFLLLGNGKGGFQTAALVPTSIGDAIPFVMAADFNQDGNLDLMEQGIDGIVMVLLGNGDGTFQQPVSSPLGETTTATTYTTADLNGDDALDVIATDTNLNSVDVFLGNGNGTFGVAKAVTLANTNYFPDAGAVADFNGDGNLDFAVAETNFPNGQVSVQFGNGDGTFQSPMVSPLAIQAINNRNLMLAGDFNGDGKPDLMIMDDYGAGFQVLLGKGDGTFQTPVNTAVSNTTLFSLGDVNGDGKTDLVAAYGNGPNTSLGVYLSNGDGTFTLGAVYTVLYFDNFALADVDGDRKLDLVITSFATPLQVFLGNGNGTFKIPISGPTSYAGGGVVVQDFNGDGKPDIAVGTDAGIALLAGNGDGTFQTPVYSACGSTTCSGSGTANLGYSGRMVAGDFNGDGKLDLATYPPFDSTLSGAVVILGNGDGTFQNPLPFSATGTPDDLLAGDFNSDGISDLAIPNQAVYGSSTSVVTLYLSGPTVDFFPGSVAFGMQNVGSTSSQQVKLTNQGTGKLTLNSIQSSGDFSETNDCATGLSKAQSCNISVTFQPSMNGRRSGRLSVTDDAVASPQVLTLVGTGVTRIASVSPSLLMFANQFVGSSAAAQSIMLSNTGNAPLTTSQVTITGPDASDFSQTNNCQNALPVQTTCGISVVFTPTSIGTKNATVLVADNAISSPQSVPVSGIGMSFGLAGSSAGSTSAAVAAGATTTYNLVIGGAGFAGTVMLSCTGAPRGANCSVPSSLSLNATSSQTLAVTVTTTSRTSASLFVHHSGLWAILVFGLLVLPPSQQRRSLSRWLTFLSLPLLLAVICSCGGGNGPVAQANANGTPAGQYSLMLTAAAGSNAQSLPLTLTVQ